MKAEFLRILGSGLGELRSIRGKSVSGGISRVCALSNKGRLIREITIRKKKERIVIILIPRGQIYPEGGILHPPKQGVLRKEQDTTEILNQ
tara:strand:+ start:265 stop:537 length:273 start_codon:yes stop_codon:yes gene_type:complete